MLRSLCLAGLVLLGATLPALAQEVTIPGTEERVMTAKDGRAYRIQIAKPTEAPPPNGFPVIYVVDGNAWFAPFVSAVRLQGRRSEISGVVPAVVVAVGYPGDAPFDVTRRVYDFVPKAPQKEAPPAPGGKPWPKSGGADEFLRFLDDELKPAIEREVKIDRTRQVLFGHSLGGLFVTYALMASPDSFQTYVAGSPSLWWNARWMFDAERDFEKRAAKKKFDADLLLTVGEYEEKVPPVDPKTASELAEKFRDSRMVSNAKEMGERLSGFGHGLRVLFREIPEEDHISMVPVAINQTLKLALHPEGRRAGVPGGAR